MNIRLAEYLGGTNTIKKLLFVLVFMFFISSAGATDLISYVQATQAGAWDVVPANLKRATDGNDATAIDDGAGGYFRTSQVAGTYLKWDIGKIRTMKGYRLYMDRQGVAGGCSGVSIEGSTDDVVFTELNGGAYVISCSGAVQHIDYTFDDNRQIRYVRLNTLRDPVLGGSVDYKVWTVMINLTNTTVGNWTMNDSVGLTVNDSSGFFNNGTLSGTSIPTWSTNLVNGSVNSTGLSFAYSSYVRIPTNISLNHSSNDFTIGGWIKANTSSTYQHIISKFSTQGRILAINPSGNLITFTPNLVTTYTDTEVVTDQKWRFVILERADGVIGLYVNDNGKFFGAYTGNTDSENDMFIGSNNGASFFFNGTMDEMFDYNYALNASERTVIYQQFQPVPAYPVGGLIINPTEATTYVNFSWHDTVYPQDEIIIATDSGFTNMVHDAFHSTDYANISLTVGTTYYWKVKQFNSGTGSYGNTSAIQTFTLGTVPTFIRVNVFDELNLSAVPYINVTLVSLPTNTSVNQSSTSTNNWVNFTNPSITDGVEYLAQVSALGYTTRNILINAPGNYSIYLPYTATAAGVSQINFVESDYTGLFPYQSTKLIVQKVINTSIVNISSNYFDATGVSTVQLINGQQYQLIVESSLGVRSLGSYIPTASVTSTLLIASFTLLPDSPFNGLVYNFTYNSNQSIVLQWSDPNSEIVSLNETITNQLNAIVLQLITSVHSGQTTYLIANTSSKYLVQLNISTVHYGYLIYSLWYNPALFTSSNASLAPTPGPNNYIIPFGNVSNVSTTSNANAPVPQWVKNLLSVSFLVVMALILNREHVARGMVLVSAFSLVFWITGMLVFDIGYVATGGVLGALFIITIVNMLSEANRS